MSVSVVKHAQRIVVKVGSSLVTAGGLGLDHAALSRWAEQIAALTEQGKEVVLVSSGAIAEGVARLGWDKRPTSVMELQAAAAVGQMGLVQAYESIFRSHGLHAAQVLLTHEDLSDRTRYLNARSTLRTLLALRVVPIVNDSHHVAAQKVARDAFHANRQQALALLLQRAHRARVDHHAATQLQMVGQPLAPRRQRFLTRHQLGSDRLTFSQAQ